MTDEQLAELERQAWAIGFGPQVSSIIKRLREMEAESEGRRKALFEVGEERRQAWQRAEQAEASLTAELRRSRELDERLRALEKAARQVPKAQRKAIADCLKGNEFGQDQWTKGYCVGLIAALTAFDHEGKRLAAVLAQKQDPKSSSLTQEPMI